MAVAETKPVPGMDIAMAKKSLILWQSNYKVSGFPGKTSQQINEARNMTHAENMMDPFNIGLYAIEAGLVGVVIYAMAVLPALFKSMI